MSWSLQVHWQGPADVHLILGQLLERTTSTQQAVREVKSDVSEIRERLAQGDANFAEMKLHMSKAGEARWEKYILEAWRVIQWGVLLWLTGSADLAVKLLGAIK